MTTLNEIAAANPPKEIMRDLLKSLGKDAPDDDPIEFGVILIAVGLEGAAWCLRVPSLSKLSHMFFQRCRSMVAGQHSATRPETAWDAQWMARRFPIDGPSTDFAVEYDLRASLAALADRLE
jgi:hypothetical protein